MEERAIERIGTICLSVSLALILVGFVRLYEFKQSEEVLAPRSFEYCIETGPETGEDLYNFYCPDLILERNGAFHMFYASILPLLIFFIIITGLGFISKKKNGEERLVKTQENVATMEHTHVDEQGNILIWDGTQWVQKDG